MRKQDIKVGDVLAATLNGRVPKGPTDRSSEKLHRVRVTELEAKRVKEGTGYGLPRTLRGVEVETLDPARIYYASKESPAGTRHIITNNRYFYAPWDEYVEERDRAEKARAERAAAREFKVAQNSARVEALSSRIVAAGLVDDAGLPLFYISAHPSSGEITVRRPSADDVEAIVALVERAIINA